MLFCYNENIITVWEKYLFNNFCRFNLARQNEYRAGRLNQPSDVWGFKDLSCRSRVSKGKPKYPTYVVCHRMFRLRNVTRDFQDCV